MNIDLRGMCFRRGAVLTVVSILALAALSSASWSLPVAEAAGSFSQVPKGEGTDRDSWQQPEKVMDAIGVKSGLTIGEVGAGNGYFTFKLARRVGETGLIYANDIDRSALRNIEEIARRKKINHIVTVLGETDRPLLPPGVLDLAIMVYVFHELTKPVELLENLKPSLKPGASLVILDRDPEKVPSAKGHFTDREKVLRLASEAGFELVRLETFLPRDMIVILRADNPSASSAAPAVEQTEEKTELPQVTRYDLHFRLFPKVNNLEADASMTVRNTTAGPVSEIPFILYRLFDVDAVTDGEGRPLSSTLSVVKFSDEKSLQVRFATVRLGRPLSPGQSAVVRLKYAGPLCGYPEVMRYVQDRIDEEYSLLRPDSLAYPMLSVPSFQGMMLAFRSKFTYRVEVEVPAGLTVACGGRPVETRRKGETTAFVFESFMPTWRLDAAAAKFKVIEDKDAGIRVYAIPGDEAQGPRFIEISKKSFRLFTDMFGALDALPGFTIIEVPEGWGGQAADFYILLPAAAFRDTKRTSELYHEVAHNWNARSKAAIQRCRYFDEAFAAYFEGLAIKEFEGDEAFIQYMNKRRDQFLRSCDRDEKNCSTPIADYWKEERGGNSYTKGAWSLYVLNRVIGDEAFRRLITGFLREYRVRPADFKDFQEFSEKTCGRSLAAFFEDWIYGAESSRLLREKLEVDKIADRYR